MFYDVKGNNMGKFEWVFVPDRKYDSQLDADMDILSATVVMLSNEYEKIFSGLDGVISAINEIAKEKK
jgi:hypothetical protein